MYSHVRSHSVDDIPSDVALQRLWNIGRRVATPLMDEFEEAPTTDDIFISCNTPDQEHQYDSNLKRPNICQVSAPQTCILSDVESDYESGDDDQESFISETNEPPKVKEPFILDASLFGDIPARYTVPALDPHQFPVIGVYIDPRVCPGFKYYVKPLNSPGDVPHTLPPMFGGRALTLQSIGRGYSRRLTFEADQNKLTNNKNYFWSDNRQEGYVFELEVVSVGDKFTVFDSNQVAQGTMEVLNIEAPQLEKATETLMDGIEKVVLINITGKVEFYETGVAKPFLIIGTVHIFKKRGNHKAVITKITNVTIGTICKGFCLTPGIQTNARRVTVRGKDIGDVPTKYTMTGLEPYEIPVVGTYVDPRIIPGFYYRVRPNDRKDHLFGGRALKLISIGMGYAKRLTFQPDSLVKPENYFWSDNHPDGVGLEPRAVHNGMKFVVIADDQRMGEATVFRADRPQREERQEFIELPNGKKAVEKYIHVEVTCHVRLENIGGGIENDHLINVYGLAIVRKDPGQREAKVIRLENVSLESQLNLFFTQTDTDLAFLPV